MRLTILAVAVGTVGGLGAGALGAGRPRHLAPAQRLRLWPLLAAGLGLQVAGSAPAAGGRPVALLASYALLVVFAGANAQVVGMWLVAVGIALNGLVMAVDGGMPVSRAAVVAAGLAGPGQASGLRLPAGRHLERPSDQLVAAADVVPVAPLREVVSLGDLVADVGVADVLVHLLRRPRERRRRAPLTRPCPARQA